MVNRLLQQQKYSKQVCLICAVSGLSRPKKLNINIFSSECFFRSKKPNSNMNLVVP